MRMTTRPPRIQNGEVIPMRKHFLSVPLCFLPHSCLCTSLEKTLYVYNKLKLFHQNIVYCNPLVFSSSTKEKSPKKEIYNSFTWQWTLWESKRNKNPKSWRATKLKTISFLFSEELNPMEEHHWQLQTECFYCHRRHRTLQNYVTWCLMFHH